ncbi:GAF domain-containing protein [Actinoplanes sp. N902-109]|uniref:GAF domain-containing protein n=1 Tax=Actinoplanes sp. (strain N902-109) TaxID=649831 RepID=UPI0003295C7A|nr:GAF domain-containing protein [Actinoplanes sp. N902-109]AGL18912.1 ANTAR domain-containing protein [Actinoplanes sp. N902-109]
MQDPERPLREHLVMLAGTPDAAAAVTALLTTITGLAADRIDAISYASITRSHGGGYTTVAASSALAAAVDDAQYADGAGPCLDAATSGHVVGVPNIRATMVWPGFRDAATRIGLRASLSVPLFAARGVPVAALNLYGRRPESLSRLTAAVWAVFDPRTAAAHPDDALDDGGAELVAGLTAAFAVRGLIQQALGVIMAADRCAAEAAYGSLCSRAATTSARMPDMARHIIAGGA